MCSPLRKGCEHAIETHESRHCLDHSITHARYVSLCFVVVPRQWMMLWEPLGGPMHRVESRPRQRDLHAGVLAERAAREPWKSGRQRRHDRQTKPLKTFSHQLSTPPRSLGPLLPPNYILGHRIRLLAADQSGDWYRPEHAYLVAGASHQRLRAAPTRQCCVSTTPNQTKAGNCMHQESQRSHCTLADRHRQASRGLIWFGTPKEPL
jgi:hypothetical protein